MARGRPKGSTSLKKYLYLLSKTNKSEFRRFVKALKGKAGRKPSKPFSLKILGGNIKAKINKVRIGKTEISV
jgi:hypothetical protein